MSGAGTVHHIKGGANAQVGLGADRELGMDFASAKGAEATGGAAARASALEAETDRGKGS